MDFAHRLTELEGLPPGRLAEADAIAAVAVAAAGAIGIPPLGPPVVRAGPAGVVVALLCRDGHIVLHALPAEGRCLVDLVARAPADPGRGLDVIARRLA
jgi:S-adenosylmethionine/arginine decarboxylase-like enzyme